MGYSIAVRAPDSIWPASNTIFLQRRWWRSVLLAAERQRTQPPGSPVCWLLEQVCSIACTEDGELALVFGDPRLVLLSSDVDLLPTVRADVRRLSQMRSFRLSDQHRARLAQIHRAGLLLIDALEQLSTGLRAAFTPREHR